jgi:hypothetical protein
MTFFDMFSVLDRLAVDEIPSFYDTRIFIIISTKERYWTISEPFELNLSPPYFCLRPKPVILLYTCISDMAGNQL